jgi:uncharacterized protein
MSAPTVRALGETEGYLELLSNTLTASRVTGAKIHDARIVAICEAHGVETLWTADRDFSRFGRVRTANPLRP